MYALKLHINLTADKWRGYSRGRQILMIACEFERAGHWMEHRNEAIVRQCDERAFELIDISAEDPKWRRGLGELLRFRELLAERYACGSMDTGHNRELLLALLSLDAEAANAMRAGT